MKKLIIQTKGVNVLLVDDNEVNLMIAKTILEQYGIEVDPAESGKEALEKARKVDYDLVVMDCLMPEMDGLETTKRIRALPGRIANVPVVAYTSSSEDEVLESYRCVGVENVLVKPLETVEVTKVLLKYIAPSKLIGIEAAREQLRQWESSSEPQETQKKSNLQTALEAVEGLNYSTGIHYAVDNEENYLRVLRAACERLAEAVAHFQSFTQTDARNHTTDSEARNDVSNHATDSEAQADSVSLETLHIDAHSMKGIFACIGMDALSHASGEVEHLTTAEQTDHQAGQPEVAKPTAYPTDQPEASEQPAQHIGQQEVSEQQTIQAQLVQYTQQLQKSLESLQNALEQYRTMQCGNNECNAFVVAVPAEEYHALLEDIKLHIKRFEIDAITDGLQHLLRATADETARTKIKDAINASELFDYDTVGKLVTSLVNDKERS